MADNTPLRLMITTPEKTILDVGVESLQFPLFDGQIGILPGRAPLVGRLGYGELVYSVNGKSHSYYIDGGFSQVNGSTISLLTNRAIRVEDLKIDEARELETNAVALPVFTDEEYVVKQREQQRAARMLELGSRN